MKTKYFLLSIIALLVITNIKAQTFEVDGINFSIIGSNEVEVAQKTECYSGDVTIPSTIENSGVTYSVTAIGPRAFYYCDTLNSVVLPNSITTIKFEAFDHCTNLISVNFPSSIHEIGNYAFWYCTSLPTVDLSQTAITTIGNYGFTHCDSLTTLVLPNTITSIGDFNFYYCGNLTDVTIPDSVLSIGNYSFAYSGLTSINIPNSVTSIDANAFVVCRDLTTIIIPNSVTLIEDYAFYNCSSLVSVNIDLDVPLSIDSSVFEQIPLYNVTLNVPIDSENAYNSTPVWEDFGSINGTLSTTDFELPYDINIIPNPVINEIRISGLNATESYKIYDLNGKKVREGNISNFDVINVENMKEGVYMLKLGNGVMKKIIKK